MACIYIYIYVCVCALVIDYSGFRWYFHVKLMGKPLFSMNHGLIFGASALLQLKESLVSLNNPSATAYTLWQFNIATVCKLTDS